MDEHEQLLNPDNYKILIQLKKNRKKKLKAQYLTADFKFSENINDALIFENFHEAEVALTKINNVNPKYSKPRIIVKYIENVVDEKWEDEKS